MHAGAIVPFTGGLHRVLAVLAVLTVILAFHPLFDCI